MSAYPSFGRGGGGDNGKTDSEGFTLARNGRGGRGGRGSISALLVRHGRGDGGGRGRGRGRGEKIQYRNQFDYLNGEAYEDADEEDDDEENSFDDKEDLTITEKQEQAKQEQQDKIEEEMKEFVDGLYGAEFIPETEFLDKNKDSGGTRIETRKARNKNLYTRTECPGRRGGDAVKQ
jgi:hypothetical protein